MVSRFRTSAWLVFALVWSALGQGCTDAQTPLETGQFALETDGLDGLFDAESPRVYLLRPLEGQEYLTTQGALPISVEFTATGMSQVAGTQFQIRMDGNVLKTVSLPGSLDVTDVAPGLHVVSVVWLVDGKRMETPGGVDSVRFSVRGPCQQADECQDWTPCSLDGCVATSSGQPMCVYLQAKEGCCLDLSECEPFHVACADGNQDGYPECVECLTAQECADDSACTQDLCLGGSCQHVAVGNCGTQADCQDGDPCTLDVCLAGSCTCQNQIIPGCCATDSQCDDGDACTQDWCGNQICRHGQPLTAPGICCSSDQACPSLGPCLLGRCEMLGPTTGRCIWEPDTGVQGCCWADEECPSDMPEWQGRCVWPAPDQPSHCELVKNPLWCSSPQESGLVINEMMVNPLVLPDVAGEWVELFNAADHSIDVSGYKLVGTDAEACELFPNEAHLLAPGAYLMVGRVADVSKNGGISLDVTCPLTLSLNNLGGELALTDSLGVQLDRWAYAGGDSGASQARVSPYSPAIPANLGIGKHPYDSYGNHGTPGAPNLDQGHDSKPSAICDDNDGCTLDLCGGGQDQRLCANLLRNGCCASDQECDDGDVCTTDVCSASGQCEAIAIPGCCTKDSQCNDAWNCTSDRCINSKCRHQPADGGAACCKQNADCPAPLGCGATACIDGRCLTQIPANCCKSAAECDDGNPCTLDQCQSSVCSHSWKPSCCSTASDCVQQLGTVPACRPVWCIQGSCRLGPKSDSCCETLEDCDDGNPCTLDVCNTTSHTCLHESAGAGCCAADVDCIEAVGGCQHSVCIANQCIPVQQPGCCTQHSECEDKNPCTQDSCLAGSCRFVPTELCCQYASDCPTRFHPCHHWECLSGMCQDITETPCGLMVDYLESFHQEQGVDWFGFGGTDLPPGTTSGQLEWRKEGLLGPDGHLKLSSSPESVVCVSTPSITVPKAVTLITVAYDWGLATWQGQMSLSTYWRADEGPWVVMESQPPSGQGMVWEENRRVTLELDSGVSTKVQVAWCLDAKTAQGWAELDSIAVGQGRPPEWNVGAMTLWASPGGHMWQLASFTDPDGLLPGSYRLSVKGDSSGWAGIYTHKKGMSLSDQVSVRVGASPGLGTYPGSHRFEVEVWQGVLHDSLVVALEVGAISCVTASECPQTTPCTQAACTQGRCVWSASVGPCCGNTRLDDGEGCDDGNLLALDGCNAQCEPEDTDGDGVVDPLDLCPQLYEVYPGDLDLDGVGDACDEDRDGDLTADIHDNCLWAANSQQADLDQDGQGDVCDLDDDGDSVPDIADNCPAAPNPMQTDTDWDGYGDECDPDGDNDGVPDLIDDCPTVPDPFQGDMDLDGAGDACDEDADGDGYDLYHDCDDRNASLLPQWSVRLVSTGAFWLFSNQLGIFRDRPLVVARQDGDLGYVPSLLEPDQAIAPTAASWELLGSGPNLALLRQAGGPITALYSGSSKGVVLGDYPVHAGLAQVTGTQAAWLGGEGLQREVFWLRQEVPEQVTQNGVAETGLVLGNDVLAWTAQGDVFVHDGQQVTQLTQDTILDESPAFWSGGLAWIRRNAQAGKGNVVLWSDALHGITYVVDDALEDHLLVGGTFGLAWARANSWGGEDVFLFRADQAQKIPGSSFDAIERLWVTDSFVAWIGRKDGQRSLWGFDGRDTLQLADHLQPDAAVAVSQDQIAVNTTFGVVVARWACVPNPDLDGDGEKALLHGGLDCDDSDPLVTPQYVLQNITQGQVAVQTAPDLHQGKLVFTASDGNDDEVFYFDGRILMRLTEDTKMDSQARIHDGYVVWQKGSGASSEIWWFDGNSLVAIPGSTGGSSPQVWGPWVTWTKVQGAGASLYLWKSGQPSPTLMTSQPLYTDSVALRFGSLAWASKVADSQIYVHDLATGQTRETGLVVGSDRYPQPYGETVAWLVNLGGWDVRLGDAQGNWPVTDDLVDDLALRYWNGVLAWVRTPTGDTAEVVRQLPDGTRSSWPDSGLQTDSLTLSHDTLAWVSTTSNQGDIKVVWRDRLLQVTQDSTPDRYPVADMDQVAWLHGQDVYVWKWVCGSDWDGDSRVNQADSCPYHYNPNQTDLDSDLLGDACDPDDDNDGVGDFLDNCADIPNSTQADLDGDLAGNECDADADGDGHLSIPYGGDDCNDQNNLVYPVWIPQVVSGASVQNRSLSMGAAGLAWAGKLGGDFELYLYRENTTLRLTENVVDDLWPWVGKEWVVWEGASGSDRDIVLYKEGQVQWLTANGVDDRGPRTDGNRVVWYSHDGQDYEVFLWDGMGTYQVTNNNKNDYHPSVMGSIVVWRGFDGSDFEVYAYQGGAVTNLSKNDTDDGIPSTDGAMVAFSHFDGNDYEIARWEDGQTTTLTDSPWDDLDPVQKDGKTVWRRDDGHDFEIAVYENHRSVQLTNDDLEKGPPGTDSGRVVWAARESAFDDWEIYTYKGGKIVQVTQNDEQDTEPAVFGDTIAWVCGDAICLAAGACNP